MSFIVLRNKKSDALTLHDASCSVVRKHFGKMKDFDSFIAQASSPTRAEAIEAVEFHGGQVKECACAKGRTRETNPVKRLNPKNADVKKALKLYKEFREALPKKIPQVDIEIPKLLTAIGNVRFIGYDTTRRGKTELYKHEFHPGSRPVLCADAETGQIFIINGRYRVTPRGIVDLDGNGKELE